jgi:hypothetical protein
MTFVKTLPRRVELGLVNSLTLEHKHYRCSGYRGIPVHLLLGPVIGPPSAQGRINDTRYGEDPHEEAPREENDDGNR